MRRSTSLLISLCSLAPLALGTAHADPVQEARELFETRRYSAAYALLEPRVGPGSSAQDRLLLAAVCNRLENWRCSVEHGKPAAQALGDDSQAQFEYALALRYKLSNVSKVKALFMVDDYREALERALELDPNNLEAREEEIGYLANAPGIGGGDKELARQRVEELERLDWRRGMKMRAVLADAEGDSAEAGRIFEAVVERHPEDADARLRLAFWAQDQELWRQADEHFARVVEDGDEVQSLAALYQRGRVRVLGRYEPELAVEFLARYVDTLDGALPLPSRSNALWRQGMAHEQLGSRDRARSAYREALDLDGDNKEARKALRALD